MTLMEFFGCGFIAFGPPLAMFIFTIARDPLRIIVLIASGFFWLLSLLLSSILWYSVVPLKEYLSFGLVFSVIFQELFRFLFYKLLRRADEGLKKVSQISDDQNITPKDINNKHIMAYVSGFGYGILSGAFSIVNVLADMVGPGTIGIKGDSQYFFLTTAFLTLCFILLHTFWGVIFFNALDRKRYIFVAGVVLSHMFVSCMTLFNRNVKISDGGDEFKTNESYYLISIISSYVVMVIVAFFAFVTAGGSFRSVHTAFTCRKGRYEMD